MTNLTEEPDGVFEEACKIVGQYILMRCTSPDDFNRSLLVQELIALNHEYKQVSGKNDFAMELAIELLMR